MPSPPAIKSKLQVHFIFTIIILFSGLKLFGQGDRYWNQNLNSEAALLSGVVIAGESGIAAIYYNPATITQMTKSSFSLSANLFSLYFLNAKNALGTNLAADRVQMDIYPRIITLTLNPKKSRKLTIEMAYFTKTNEYLQINKGNALNLDLIPSNPGNEEYTASYYLRSRFLDYYGGAGFGYKISPSFAFGFSGMISYKNDQYYNLATASAFSEPGPYSGTSSQFLSDSRFLLNYNLYDVRLITKAGLYLKKESWALGANINLPSLKLFGNGTVVKEYEYSNIHKDPASLESSNLFYSGRQSECTSYFKDPLSVSAGANFYSPAGKSILLISIEYFCRIPDWDYIKANHDPGSDGYNYTPYEPEQWLSFRTRQQPVFNAGVAFKNNVNEKLMISGGFRTDFTYTQVEHTPEFPEINSKTNYPLNVYHLNSGIGYNFRRGSIILGMQLSHGQKKEQRQIINITEPVEYPGDTQMPLTGHLNDNVIIMYTDISLYFGFLFNFSKE